MNILTEAQKGYISDQKYPRNLQKNVSYILIILLKYIFFQFLDCGIIMPIPKDTLASKKVIIIC